PIDEAVRHLEDMIVGAAAPDRGTRLTATRLLAELIAMRGEFERSRSLIDEAEALANELGLEIFYASGVLRGAGTAAMLEGHHDAAERRLAQGAEVLRRAGDLAHLSSVLALQAESVTAQGRHEEALALTEEAERATLSGDVDAEVNWMRVRGKTLARLGRHYEAVEFADGAAEKARPTDYLDLLASAALDRGEVMELAGRRADAVLAVQEALAAFERKGHRVGVAAARARLDALDAARGR
ncbi:MAG: hypothetical protein M3295_04895, partial [Chloroflexota bacterium]|nr:hypothetical protein [Chloroflexota bacterium]